MQGAETSLRSLSSEGLEAGEVNSTHTWPCRNFGVGRVPISADGALQHPPCSPSHRHTTTSGKELPQPSVSQHCRDKSGETLNQPLMAPHHGTLIREKASLKQGRQPLGCGSGTGSTQRGTEVAASMGTPTGCEGLQPLECWWLLEGWDALLCAPGRGREMQMRFKK